MARNEILVNLNATYKVSRKHNRNAIGSEISEEYTKLGKDKIIKHDFF